MQYKGTAFTPVPESVKVTHHYEHGEPRIVVCYGPNPNRRRAIVHVVAAMVCGSAVLLLGVFFIIVVSVSYLIPDRWRHFSERRGYKMCKWKIAFTVAFHVLNHFYINGHLKKILLRFEIR